MVATVPAPFQPGDAPRPDLQSWSPGDVRCGDVVLPANAVRRPYTALRWDTSAAPPRTYRFRLDAHGAPFSIDGPAGTYEPSVSDITPSLAATRFTVSGPLNGCEVTYTSKTTSFGDAPIGDLISYSITPQNGPLPDAGWARIKPVGGDCDREPRAQWLRAVSPDYIHLGGEPGARDWSLVSYDLDAKGRPTSVHTAESTRNLALDRAALKAMADSRQTEGPRRGCLNPFVRIATRLPAPAEVNLDTLRPAGSTCPKQLSWKTKPALVYPDNWRRRAIEGWAVIAFDVAPWGAVGNARVLAAEPSSEFGMAATQIISGAKMPASQSGYAGCIERVEYKMGPGTPEPSSPPRTAT
ncbi:energy transducer TonB [Sphingomonas phyllosphaerae]|uniref:energy transducer TonB n=1 Tax=Sphingomonas phyllosphaerae TaxID=257003 RepID=UPI002FF93F25